MSFTDKSTHTDSPIGYMATEPGNTEQDVVILVETDQELQLNQHAEQVELKAQRVVESFPFFSSTSTEENLVDTYPTVIPDTTESFLNTTATLNPPQGINETSSPTEMSFGSEHSTTLMNSTISTTETYNSSQNTSLLPTIYNETDSHNNLNFTFHQTETESTTEFPESSQEPHTHNQTVTDTNPENSTQPSERPKDSQEIQETILNFGKAQVNYSKTDSNHTQEENVLEVTLMTLEPMVQVKMDEAAAEDSLQMIFSTQASKEEAQATKSSIMEQTSLWTPLDGSGDTSQGMSSINLKVYAL